jgi:thiamine biosynthesis lipoprotein ApbE
MLEKIKDILALIREAALVILFFLLLIFPGCFNTILVNAGFTEGNVMGFTWKEKAQQSMETADSSQQVAQAATNRLDEMQKKLDNISKKLSAVGSTTNNPEVHALKMQVDSSKEAVKVSSSHLAMRLQTQQIKLRDIRNDIKPKQ